MKLHNCEHPDGRAEEQGETRRRCHESEKYKQIDISLKKLQKGKKMKKKTSSLTRINTLIDGEKSG